jgi:hypothetical protein
MSVQKREPFQKKMYTGFFSGRVIAVNPTKEELSEILGFEPKEEPVYIETNKFNNKEQALITFWMEIDHPEKIKMSHTFYLINEVAVGRNSGKTQFVNQSGSYSWVFQKEDLVSWFRNFEDKNGEIIDECEVRPAIQGEADLYSFLRSWYGQANFKSKNTNILIDVKKLFLDPVKYAKSEYGTRIELEKQYLAETDPDVREDLNKNIITTNVTGLATVRISEKEGSINYYQHIYKEFIQNYLVKKLRLAVMNNLWDPKNGADKALAKFYDGLVNKNGTKDAYKIQMLAPFKEEDHPQTSNETIINSESNSGVDY